MDKIEAGLLRKGCIGTYWQEDARSGLRMADATYQSSYWPEVKTPDRCNPYVWPKLESSLSELLKGTPDDRRLAIELYQGKLEDECTSLLYEAIASKSSDVETIEQIMKKGASITWLEKGDEGPLILAAARGLHEILLSMVAQLRSKDDVIARQYEALVLHEVGKFDVRRMEKLVSLGLRPGRDIYGRETVLQVARISKGPLRENQFLTELIANHNPFSTDSHGDTIFHVVRDSVLLEDLLRCLFKERRQDLLNGLLVEDCDGYLPWPLSGLDPSCRVWGIRVVKPDVDPTLVLEGAGFTTEEVVMLMGRANRGPTPLKWDSEIEEPAYLRPIVVELVHSRENDKLRNQIEFKW